jgi:hypothetical protein
MGESLVKLASPAVHNGLVAWKLPYFPVKCQIISYFPDYYVEFALSTLRRGILIQSRLANLSSLGKECYFRKRHVERW